jgi:hypothetical protein
MDETLTTEQKTQALRGFGRKAYRDGFWAADGIHRAVCHFGNLTTEERNQVNQGWIAERSELAEVES